MQEQRIGQMPLDVIGGKLTTVFPPCSSWSYKMYLPCAIFCNHHARPVLNFCEAVHISLRTNSMPDSDWFQDRCRELWRKKGKFMLYKSRGVKIVPREVTSRAFESRASGKTSNHGLVAVSYNAFSHTHRIETNRRMTRAEKSRVQINISFFRLGLSARPKSAILESSNCYIFLSRVLC